MNHIHVIDANAWLRRALNREQLGSVDMDPRLLFEKSLANPVPEIWVWDGPRNNERRRAIFPGYKIRDYTGQEDIFAGLKIYRELLEHTPAVQVTVPDYEADDVCFTLAKKYGSAGIFVDVFTNDQDFLQLHALPNVRVNGVSLPDNIPPEYVSLWKALCGDKSDKIPGIPGFGEKSFQAMRELWPVLDAALANRDPKPVRDAPFRKGIKSWLMFDENLSLIFDYHQITKMLDVPHDLIDEHLTVGTADPKAGHAILKEFMF